MNDIYKNLKIAVVHDHLAWKGGGERTALLTALYLDADFITVYANPDTFPEYQEKLGNRLKVLTTSVLDKEIIRFFWIRHVFFKNRALFKKYDIIIASGHSATEAVSKYSNPTSSRILYCHNPPRRIYDLFKVSRARYKWFLRPGYTLFTKYWDYVYKKALHGFDYIVTNSEHIKNALSYYTKFVANEVIWPPILIDKFLWLEQGDYFLSWARVDEVKRVELIVEAFTKMPDKKLVVASDGSKMSLVKEIAKGHDNIKIIGWQSDEALKELVGKALAVIYIPVNEDAGMTHLEANSAGKPVIGVDEGGLKESIIEGVTGFKIKANPTIDDLITAVKKITPEWCLERKQDCIDQAKKYSADIFAEKIKDVIKRNNPNLPIIGVDASRWEDPRYPGEEKRTGVEVYCRDVIKNLVEIIDLEKFRLRLYAPVIIKEFSTTIQKIIPGKKFWTIFYLARELKRRAIDYFFTPGYFIPAHAPKNSTAVIHDVKFKSDPKKYSFKEKIRQAFATNKNIKRAEKIITVSQESKKGILKYYHQKDFKVKVIPIGYDRWINGQENSERKKTILFVGRLEKKKSINVLIDAFAIFSKTNPDWELLLAGKEGFGADKFFELAKEKKLGDKIKFLGYIDDATKKKLFLEAGLFVHPGSSEGSAIPLFEAWDACVPAIVSDANIMKEVSNEGALLFKVEDYEDLALKITSLISDQTLRNILIKKGLDNLRKSSLKNMAEEVLKVIISK